MRVLVVDADLRTAESLVERLVKQGHNVEHTESGRGALDTYKQADLVLLDLELPDLDGLEVCRSIRAGSEIPLITFTHSGTELDKVLSLQAGADDCIAKPYGFRELVARMDALMRRVLARGPNHRPISVGDLHIDPSGRQVCLGARLVELTRKEFDLLYLLASLPGRVFSRKEIMAEVWEDDWAVSSRTVDTHVSTLRNKLGTGASIMTVRGVGYRLGGP